MAHWLALWLLGWGIAQGQVPGGALFDHSATNPSGPAAGPGRFHRVQFARLNAERMAWLQGGGTGNQARLVLNLFSNEQDTALIDRLRVLGANRMVARGKIEGVEASLVVLSLNDGALAGSVFIPGRGSYQIQHISGGLHRIAELDSSRMPRCGLQPRSSSFVSTLQTASLLSVEPAPSGTNVMIDLLVVYTPAAREGAGGTNGMNALIDAAVEEANAAYENSLVNARLQLVHRAEVNYQETGNISEDLDQLEEDEPEHAATRLIHSLRAQYGADLVCMITETTGGPLGLANLMHEVEVEFSENAFSIVQRQYALAYQVLAHELGHNMGCQHDRESSTSPGAYSYSYGYRFSVSNLTYHTVMAPQPGSPIPYFSNPEVQFLNVPTGIDEQFTNSANNAKTINRTAATVALFNTLLRTGTPPHIIITSPTNQAFYLVPVQLQFTVNATDDDGVVEEVEFVVNGAEIAEVRQFPFSLHWTNSTPGTYALRAKARDNSGWETRSQIVVFTLEFPPPAFQLGGCQRQADGSFSLSAVGLPGLDYVISVSEDLVDWVTLSSGFFTNNLFDFVDLEASTAARRFYRIDRQP